MRTTIFPTCVGFHARLGLRQVLEVVDAVDHRFQLAAREERQEIALEAFDRDAALRGVAQAVRDAEEPEALEWSASMSISAFITPST